tara:strand:- start:16 stop:189 length:174 start_codon:yes stop_codon:yes gene_type:complete
MDFEDKSIRKPELRISSGTESLKEEGTYAKGGVIGCLIAAKLKLPAAALITVSSKST